MAAKRVDDRLDLIAQAKINIDQGRVSIGQVGTGEHTSPGEMEEQRATADEGFVVSVKSGWNLTQQLGE
jgi:hypothetical protein